MAKYATLKAAVEAAIKTNGQQQITGQVLQTQLVNMITSLGKYFQSFGGLATPAGSFTAGDESVTFLAVEAGTYTNFGGAVLDGKTLHILYYDGSWHDADTLIPSGAAFEAALALAIKGSQSGIAEGIADTISAGTAQEFLQRQSGGDGVNCIKRIKGKTIAWNQLIKNGNFTSTSNWVASMTISAANNVLTAVSVAGSGNYVSQNLDADIVAGHKYLIVINYISNKKVSLQFPGTNTGSLVATDSWTQKAFVYTAEQANKLFYLYNYTTLAAGEWTLQLRNIILVDLTLLGLGDLTAAQFEALYPALYYAPASVLKSNDAAALLTDGRNQLDGIWHEGRIDSTTGEVVVASNHSYSNYIPVFPNTQYFEKVWLDLRYYDANKNYIRGENGGENMIFTTPANCAYLRVTGGVSPAIMPSYNPIINLSDASFNGTYEPYWQRVLALRLSELTGIPEGGTEADRVTMFPNGLGGAGSAFDSIFVENGVTKARGAMLAEVDLGDLTWTATSEGGGADGYVAEVSGMKTMASTAQNLICSRFVISYSNTKGSIYTTDNKVVVPKVNDTYADAATFKAAMAGVKLLAEAATPIIYTDLQYADGTPFTMPATILVDNYGTERIQAPEGATTPSAPFCCDSNYSIGVANLVKRLAALENAE